MTKQQGEIWSMCCAQLKYHANNHKRPTKGAVIESSITSIVLNEPLLSTGIPGSFMMSFICQSFVSPFVIIISVMLGKWSPSHLGPGVALLKSLFAYGLANCDSTVLSAWPVFTVLLKQPNDNNPSLCFTGTTIPTCKRFSCKMQQMCKLRCSSQ